MRDEWANAGPSHRKQVSTEHYDYTSYVDQKRWSSLWHQLDETMRLQPSSILEIGPGPGLYKAVAAQFGHTVKTLDLDPELNPDYSASVLDMPFEDGTFDMVCAFQMLEHLPFDESLHAFAEMVRVSARYVLISVPDARPVYPVSIVLPKKRACRFLVPSPRFWPLEHVFDGEHYWELNKKHFALPAVLDQWLAQGPVSLLATYRVHANAYHRFFVFSTSRNEGSISSVNACRAGM